jgi:hypothetical protein
MINCKWIPEIGMWEVTEDGRFLIACDDYPTVVAFMVDRVSVGKVARLGTLINE